MMSPKVLEAGGLIFWFHSYDALHEKRASVHVGKGSQDDHSYKLCRSSGTQTGSRR